MVDLIDGDHRKGSAACAAVAGYPHVSVPMGCIERLPVGCLLWAPMRTNLSSVLRTFETALKGG
jgi:Asp-tRNA(Asn)/Glu-tRNA(Gln) amidotransferase A subunit family amidase